jgi:hypothetical protein
MPDAGKRKTGLALASCHPACDLLCYENHPYRRPSIQPMSMSSIRRIHLLGFVAEIRHIHENMPDRRFCFVLGAGASKPSGIPTAGELGLDWLKKLHTESGGAVEDFAKWLSNGDHAIKELPPKTGIADTAVIAAAYPAIYQAKWGHDRAQGHAEIERHIEAATASYGYYALAEILASDDPAPPFAPQCGYHPKLRQSSC